MLASDATCNAKLDPLEISYKHKAISLLVCKYEQKTIIGIQYTIEAKGKTVNNAVLPLGHENYSSPGAIHTTKNAISLLL